MAASSIHLPGTTLEGGGQLVRIALGLSALTRQAIHITDIRGNRSGGGGLKNQHMTAVNFLSKACSAKTIGAEVKSKTLEFVPEVEQGSFSPFKKTTLADGVKVLAGSVNINGLGSITLLFQALLPYLLFTPLSFAVPADSASIAQQPLPILLNVQGGTNVSRSPSIDYVQQVLIPMLELIGIPRLKIRVQQRGWNTGSRNMGAVTFKIQPLAIGASLPAFTLANRGEVTEIRATVLAPAGSWKSLEQAIRRKISERSLRHLNGLDVPIDFDFEDSRHSSRYYVLLVATTTTGIKLGRDCLYERRIRDPDDAAKVIAERVTKDLVFEIKSGACVDEHMRDQVVIFQALAKGRSTVESGSRQNPAQLSDPPEKRERSLHTKTAEWVCLELLGVEFDENGDCQGAGFVTGERFARRQTEGAAESGSPDQVLTSDMARLDI